MHLSLFLASLFDKTNVHVGVWSSAHRDNVYEISQKTFGKYFHRLLFVYDRSDCEGAPMGKHTPKSVRKPLSRIFDEPEIQNQNTWLWNEVCIYLTKDKYYIDR
jgi:hypothetical protein